MDTPKQIDDGGPAFPRDNKWQLDGSILQRGAKGMSLRDWFAGNEFIDMSESFEWELCEALAGPRPLGNSKTNPVEWFNWSNKWQSAVRYARADALIAARRK